MQPALLVGRHQGGPYSGPNPDRRVSCHRRGRHQGGPCQYTPAHEEVPKNLPVKTPYHSPPPQINAQSPHQITCQRPRPFSVSSAQARPQAFSPFDNCLSWYLFKVSSAQARPQAFSHFDPLPSARCFSCFKRASASPGF